MQPTIIALISIIPACLAAILTYMIQKRKFESLLATKKEENALELKKQLSEELKKNYISLQEAKKQSLSVKLTGTPLPALDDYRKSGEKARKSGEKAGRS